MANSFHLRLPQLRNPTLDGVACRSTRLQTRSKPWSSLSWSHQTLSDDDKPKQENDMKIPIAVDVRRAESERVVDERRVDHHSAFGPLQEVRQIKQMTVAAAYPVPGAVLVQHEDLARREPTLSTALPIFHNPDYSPPLIFSIIKYYSHYYYIITIIYHTF